MRSGTLRWGCVTPAPEALGMSLQKDSTGIHGRSPRGQAAFLALRGVLSPQPGAQGLLALPQTLHRRRGS